MCRMIKIMFLFFFSKIGFYSYVSLFPLIIKGTLPYRKYGSGEEVIKKDKPKSLRLT